MPQNALKGLLGLNRLERMDEEERRKYMADNMSYFSQFDYNPSLKEKVMNVAWDNHKFKKAFGNDAFNKYGESTETAYNYRNAIYNTWDTQRKLLDNNKVINKTFYDYLAPYNADGTFNPNKGLGNKALWDQYNEMSPEAKLKLMRSKWLSPAEEKQQWEKEGKSYNELSKEVSSSPFTDVLGVGYANAAFNTIHSEGNRQKRQEENQRLLDNIYNDDLKQKTHTLGSEVSKAYANLRMSDDQVKKAFYDQFINPDSENSIVQVGAGELASHWNSDEMKDFSIDDMRQALAKKQVYMQYMSPYAAGQALNNEAKDYLADHQGFFKKAGLFMKDLKNSALSYTADKVNGFYNTALIASGKAFDKHTVFQDDQGNILSLKDNRIKYDDKGTPVYVMDDGKYHPLHKVNLTTMTLRNAGKDTEGNEIGSAGPDWLTLNPQYWTRAEQFNTLNPDEQKQYEKLGSSPYKVVYRPNDDSDLWYESFKMASFQVADALSMLIPYGIGTAGKVMETANIASKSLSGLNKVMNATGKFIHGASSLLTSESKFGQIAQGTAGALGIANAYQRGTFQETLAQNLANVEETLFNKSRGEVGKKYEDDKDYKAKVDNRIANTVADLENKYLEAQGIQAKGTDKAAFIPKEVEDRFKQQAREAVFEDEAQTLATTLKNSDEYHKLQERAVSSASDAALNTFWPEAIKYGLVNTFGYRKWLYTNPTSLAKTAQKAGKFFNNIKEVTTEGGKKRLALSSKFSTMGSKAKQLGKTAASQFWGGAWTNGTDDMMTDAAERINSDSFGKYLNGYYNGDAVADTYGFADGLYSYFKGLSNSMGQETTENAAIVGGLGSIVSFTPHFSNIASLATKSGREAYRNRFQREYRRDDSTGIIQKDEHGNPIQDKVSWKDNWRDRAAFFIQNGVLNTYYGNKQQEGQLQEHVDFVNNILDNYNDFKDIENLLASNRALDDAVSEGDKKTARFITALQSVNTLRNLANNSQDPAALSSVIQKAKNTIDTLTSMDTDMNKLDLDIETNLPTDGFLKNLVSQYRAMNPDMPVNMYTVRQSVSNMVKNAKDIAKAAEAYDKAEEEVSKAERNYGESFAIPVREKLKLNQALDGHWRERLESMKQEIGDTSTKEEIAKEDILPSVGGKKNAELLSAAYKEQIVEISDELDNQNTETEVAKKAFDDAKSALEENKDESKTYELQKKVNEAQAKYDDARLQSKYILEQLHSTVRKDDKVKEAIELAEQEGYKDKVLTADEIMALDPVTRARMMNKENRDLYSDEQKTEIEKLERKLQIQDSDALQKIQDIALLSQRIESNSDAYNRIIQNPEAAAVRFEAQRSADALTGYHLINQRNAQTVANTINEFDNAMKAYKDVRKEDKEKYVYRALRKLNTTLLDIIKNNNLLPQYSTQILQAEKWAKVTEDVDSVISAQKDKDQAWKDNIRKNIDSIVETANDRDEIIANLEKAIDDVENPQAKEDLDLILKGMEKMGYQRDTTVLENRRKKKDREEKNRKKLEEKKQKVNDAAQAAAAEQAAKETEAKNAATDNEVPANGEGLIPTESISPEDAVPANDVNADGSNLNQTMETPNFAEDAEETGKRENVSWASTLMDSAAEAGTVDTGKIWTGTKNNAAQDNLKVTLQKHGMAEGKTITFATHAPETIAVAPEEWYADPEDPNSTSKEELKKEGITKDTPFRAKSLFGINGNWYFEGGFLGHKGEYRIKASSKFDLDNAIEREKTSREAELMAQGVDTGNTTLIDKGDSVESKSESIEEQAETSDNNITGYDVSDNSTDISHANTVGESNIKNNAITLSGKAMSEYDPTELAENGVMKYKQGANPKDSRSKFLAWMKNAGIHLQSIIDDDLPRISAINPHAKVKFMTVRSDNNATHDVDVQSHLFLVLDYNDKVNKGITKMHNKDNGGVITSNGKQYLIIGVAGYGNQRNTDRLALYDILYSNNPHSPNGYGLVMRGRKKYFDEHPDDRFYVPENLETEIVPGSQTPGYIVRQLEEDKNPEYRSISEILADDKRNPHGYDMSILSWGIQEASKLLIISPDKRVKISDVMWLRNPMGNVGTAFVYIPAGNGKMVPAYLKPLFYNEMKDGKLKDRVNSFLNQVTSMDYETRLGAVTELLRIFYFDTEAKGGDNILLRKNRAEISLVSKGTVFATFTLDSHFDRQAFLDAFSTMNPRVNITGTVLGSKELLEEWDEAGALETDAAKLGTAGSSYSIYGVDAEGNMITPKETVDNRQHQKPVDSDYRRDNRSQVVFKHRYYTLEDGTYYLNGKPVTDTNTLQQLEYNQRVIENNYEAVDSRGVWDYYILSQGDNPEVVRINKNTKEAVRLSDEKAKEWLESRAKAEAEKQRKEAAKEALKQEPQNVEDVDLDIEEETDETVATEEQQKEGQERQPVSKKAKVRLIEPTSSTERTAPTASTAHKAASATQTFAQLYRSPKHKTKVRKVIRAKWSDAPHNNKELAEYLRKKNIEVDAIGTSQEDIDAWIKTIEDCR